MHQTAGPMRDATCKARRSHLVFIRDTR